MDGPSGATDPPLEKEGARIAALCARIAELEAENARLLSAQDAAQIGVFEQHFSAGAAIWSATLFRLYGLSPDDRGMDDERFLALVHPQDRDLHRARRLALRADPAVVQFAHEFRIIRADTGETRWIASSGEYVRDAEGRPVSVRGVQYDVTERKRAELSLAQRETELARVQRVGRLAGFQVDLRDPAMPSRRSPEYRRLHGLPEGKETETHFEWLARIHPDDQPRCDRAYREAAAQHLTRFALEYRILLPSGEVRWIGAVNEIEYDAEGRPLHLVGAHQDITERKRAEAELADSQARLQEALDAGEMGSWRRDFVTGIVTRDERLLRLAGLPPEAAASAGDDFDALLHPEDRPARDAALKQALAGDGIYRTEFRIRRADTGEERWLAARGRMVRDTDGRPVRLVGVNFDITDRKRSEERQKLLMQEVDHRAKNALAVVQSLVRLSDLGDPKLFTETLQGRVAALARAHTLLSRGAWTGADLGSVIRHELEPYAEQSRIAMSGTPVRLKPSAVQPASMIFHELATNAAKYGAFSTPEGRLSIGWNSAGGDRLVLTWQEQGGPPLAGPPRRRGFGTTLLESILRAQLDADVTMAWEPTGLRCTIQFDREVFDHLRP